MDWGAVKIIDCKTLQEFTPQEGDEFYVMHKGSGSYFEEVDGKTRKSTGKPQMFRMIDKERGKIMACGTKKKPKPVKK